ncbi:MAG: hypothetical protein ACRD4S_17535 [Candidatus Acidiferrales bacterium]
MRPIAPWRSVSAILLFALFSPVVFAQSSAPTPQPPVRDPQAVATLQSAFSAMGGQNLAQIQDTKMTTQQTSPDGTSSAVTFTTSGTTMLRVETQSSDGTSIFVMNATTPSSQNDGAAVENVPWLSVSGGGITHIPLLSVLSYWSQPGTTLQYVGLEQLGTQSVYHIRIQRPLDGSYGLGPNDVPCDLYIDAKTLFLSRLVYPLRSPGNLTAIARVAVDYSNFKVSNGIAVPYTIISTVNGQLLNEQQVVSFAVNVGTSASDFDLR